MNNKSYYSDLNLLPIYEKVLAGERLSFEDGLSLFACPDITAIGSLAHHVRMKLHQDKTYYVVNRHINYTNICVNRCTFCAFRCESKEESNAFCLTHAEIMESIAKSYNTNLQLDELHIVGACHPELPFSWFEELLQKVSTTYPNLQIKAFTAVEIAHFASLEKCSTLEVLQRLKKVGLKMMPGGGAEIFDATLRQKICPEKADAKTWLNIAGQAHKLGIRTNATMLFGHVESYENRIDHLCKLREQQDKSKGFTCFIPLPFLTKNNNLELPDNSNSQQKGIDQLKTIAISRLMLDNILHIKAYWVMLGVKLAQTALWYGANDLDGTIVEEKIGHMAGAESAQGMTIAELENMIINSQFKPIRRNAIFEAIAT